MKGAFWKFLSFILAGIIIGLVGADKLALGAKAIYKGDFRFKQKGKGNVMDADVTLEVPEISPKAQRIKERLERQKARAQKKLDKQHE